jgi:bis(5'-nucleosidyl)-tetraphosphatase
MEPAVRAAGFVIYRRMPEVPQFLLMRASYGNMHWTPPKGHVDPGESDYETALRETEEEAGFKSDVLRVVLDFKVELNYMVTSHRDGVNRPKIVTYWLAELMNPQKNEVKMSEEHQDFKWLPLQEAMDLNGFKDQNEAFKKCEAKIASL